MTALSYASGTSNEPLLGITIGDKFDEIVSQYPDNDALIVHHQKVKWSYRELQQQVNDCAKALIASGIKKGDRVGIWSSNRSEWTVLQFATAKAGAILVNINPSYRIHELEYALNQSGCKMLVLADKFKSSNYEKMILELAPEISHAKIGQLHATILPELTTVISMSDNPPKGMLPWSSFMGRAKECLDEILEKRQGELSFDDPINIQYTSGTTGFPKGATLSHHNILNNAYFVARTMQFTDKDRVIIPVPLYHCFGMVLGNLGCLTHGACMIYPCEGFDPLAVLQAVEKEKATALYGVPTMFIAELEHPEFDKFDLSSLHTGIMAGSPCPIEVLKKVHSLMHMKDVQIAYGMTEISPVCTQTRMGTPLEKQISTVGQIHPHLEVKIIDPETGLTVPLGTTGELCARGYSVMLRYWNNEEQTKSTIDSARWIHTEDLATMDEDGYVNIVGRIKDMIIRGGENIYPKEIEEYLFTHPKVSEVKVIGVPDIKYGEAVMAWVKLKEGETSSAEELTEYCKGNIAHFKVPKYFKFTESFPMTVTGKIRKIEMRQISIRELELDAASKIETA
ncbi:AMP-binding protein [Lentiprolixibacter aurantiacus]|uniref:AMP-binding protein n=1 Tax=Lentiprolixibacter aurantiacus TaxID=2993939 RepID=A0AAE3ML15_9FLAO|nr:AMP-binding protein [Lentiprolixibacter aurantiacus]MCX2719720.1 AMP-binding protein [Lentiprolixibacter aurantiacus]